MHFTTYLLKVYALKNQISSLKRYPFPKNPFQVKLVLKKNSRYLGKSIKNTGDHNTK